MVERTEGFCEWGRIDFVFSLSNEVDDFFIIVLSGKSPVHRYPWADLISQGKKEGTPRISFFYASSHILSSHRGPVELEKESWTSLCRLLERQDRVKGKVREDSSSK